MEKFKNFVYDKSDLLIALLIIAVAGLIIWFGINNIMEPYTEKADAKTATQVEEPVDTTTPPAADATTTDDAQQTPAENSADGGTTQAASIIILAGENSDQIAEKLLAAKVIPDKNTFYAKLEELGIANKIQEGTFEIPAGSSLEDVCKIITKTN